MAKFMTKSLLLTFIMFLGVIIGIQQASHGIQQMRGYETEETVEAVQLKQKDDGKLEATILGNQVTSHDLQKKQEQLEKIEAFNFFSQIGKSLANLVQKGTSAIIEGILELIEAYT